MFKVLRVLRKMPKIGGLSKVECKRVNFVNTILYLYEIFNPWSIFARKPIDNIEPERRLNYLFYLIPMNKTNLLLKNRILLLMYNSYKRKDQTSKYDDIINDLKNHDIRNMVADSIITIKDGAVLHGFWW